MKAGIKRGTKAREFVEEKIYGNAALLNKLLERRKDGLNQLLILNTLSELDIKYAKGTHYSYFHSDLLRSLERKVERFGEKSFPLSEKQREHICREWAEFWEVELNNGK